MAGIFFFLLNRDIGIWICGFCVLFGSFSLINGFKAEDKFKELTEYKRKGTINGIIARPVPVSFELAELKTEMECINVGLALHNKGSYDDSVRAFDKAIELNPNSASAWNGKGDALKAQNNYDKAGMAYDKALELNPQLADAWRNRGIILGHSGKYDEAILAYNKAIEIAPRDVDILYNKGIALRSLGRITEADGIFAKSKRELNCKGNNLFDLENYVEAIKAYDMALEADPNYANAWVNKGTASYKLGMYQEAIASFNRAIEINPQHPDAWYHKGFVLKKIGFMSESTNAFAKAKELGYVG